MSGWAWRWLGEILGVREVLSEVAGDLGEGLELGVGDGPQPWATLKVALKLLAADASFEAANACIQTHGGFGFAEEYDVERKFRETRLYQVAPISTNLILSYLAEHVLGMPRSY